METTIVCPHCKQTLEITQALRHQIEEQLLNTLEEQHKQELRLFEEKSKQEIAQVRKQVAESIQKEFEDKNQFELNDLKKQLIDKEKKVGEYREQEMKLREEKRKLEEKEKDLELQVARTIDQERKRIEEETTKRMIEEHHLKELEKEKVINDLKHALEDAQRKAQQGSQQLQGEVLELDVEQTLRQTFPDDIIEPVGKGITGSDIRQIVRSTRGTHCGTILWECKRTKTWTDSWLGKLKDDMLHEKANVAAIISTAMPKDTSNGMVLKENIWIASFPLLIPLAILLRKSLVDVARQKAIAASKDEKAGMLYEYITSHVFVQQVEAMVTIYQEMKEQLLKERMVFEKQWKIRESQIDKIYTGLVQVVGNVEGRVGKAMPQIKGLSLSDGLETDQELLKLE